MEESLIEKIKREAEETFPVPPSWKNEDKNYVYRIDDYRYGYTKAALHYSQIIEQKDKEIERLKALLLKYRDWEADLISEDKMWWPFHTGDVITGKIYDKMLELQYERNDLLASYNNK